VRPIATLLIAALFAAAPSPASATRIALYRAGAAVVTPGTLEDPGTYGVGYGFNLGVSVPFMHRLAITLDVAHDRLRWENGSEVTIATESLTRDDLSVTSLMLGADVAFRRGNEARPLITVGLGVARVAPGDAEIIDLLAGRRTQPEESETVFAMSAAAGLRLRGPWWPGAMRMTIGVMGLGREEFAYVVPLRIQVEF